MRPILQAGLIVVTLALPVNDAFAQGIFGAIINGIAVGQAQKAWDQTDPSIRDCLQSKFNLDTTQLARRAISPTNPQVAGYINNCKNIIAQQQAQQERAKEAQEQQERDAAAAEEQHQRDAAAAQVEQQKEAQEQQRQAADKQKADKAAAAAKKIEDAKQYAALAQKYGAKTADAISSHTILIGMTQDQVIESKGQPMAKQVVPPSDELWKYGADQIVLTKGRVTYVGH
jgi:regulator of protease activity HflC (stomatin/prohibitin superfamily)